MLFSKLDGDGAAEGRNVREGGKIWSGGLHEGVGYLAAPTSDGEDD